jgi:hypothetical protein
MESPPRALIVVSWLWQPVVKVENGENRPSGAKARRFLSVIYGTAEAVPFQNLTFTTGL